MRVLPVAALALAVSSAAGAAELRPAQAHSLDLGPVQGTAYYTVESDGYRLVATLAAADAAAVPVRVVATLAPDQRVSLSVPGAAGPGPVVAFARRGDRVEVASTGY
ncbi:hypothetical protein OPKNFCMD_1654 [Methylobacterium crusticola]|uniref:Uncharacterized protein n=1 Tax=Methylobacterium crusticola TaxID=1697972 RepID=A0ABQ4QUB8_9HYPH|nr:hypothetical protein [Methylobacterium crusticola]GJD48928.1 hypothetical protein OPKNFCMD_1654 [Methylobacterium crusticola]